MVDQQLKEHRAEVRALLKENVKQTLQLELWPWIQFISTLIFLAFIILGDWENGISAAGYLAFFIWILTQLFAVYKTYKNEKI